MDENIVNSGSITYAIRGRDVLRARGYKAYMLRSRGKSSAGCGYSISTNCPRQEIARIFAEEKVKYLSIAQGDAV